MIVSARSTSLKVLILQHEAATPAGHLEEWLEQRRAAVDVCRLDERADMPEPRDFDLVVSLGSELAAYDDRTPYVPLEAEILRAAFGSDIPVLGLCFGGQLLARALGGTALRNDRSEIGWMSLRTVDPDLVPEGPWFEWHHDRFSVPSKGTLIAENEAGPQAFVIGRSLGLQFHPEVTPEIVEGWIGMSRDELDRHGVDADRLLEETRRQAPRSRLRAMTLFDRFLTHVAGVKTHT
jgi:GMP synthase (glutamine-hydrolysing)